jgi:hypothetical protein
MITLPDRCKVNKFIPKKTFYEKIGVSTSIKDDFINNIDKITWLYKLSEDTLGISKSQDVEEIQIFEIILKEKVLPKKIIKIISKAIPYKILFILKYDKDYCYSIKVDNIYFTEWNEDIEFNINGLTLETIYENIVKSIIKENNNTNTFDNIIENKSKVDELSKKIEQLTNKVNNEKQFNKKVELNLELQRLKKEMEELKNE